MTEQSNTFCRLAWTSMTTTQHGSCKLCSIVEDERAILDWRDVPRPVNWAEDGIGSIWNGSYMQDVRRRMLAGERVHDCEPCYSVESSGGVSGRMSANDDQVYTTDDTRDIVAANLPIRLELRVGNRCNLSCHSCWSGGSSTVHGLRQDALSMNEDSSLVMPAWLRWAWRGEINGLSRKQQFYSRGDDYLATDMGLENFTRMSNTLRKLYITGGEPTLDESICAYLDTMKITNNGCHVGWATNCTVWNEPLMERMGHFLWSEIQLSIDAVGPANEYIRKPSRWEDVDANARRYMLDTRVKDLKVFTVVGALNAAVIPDLLDYLRRMADETSRRVVWWPLILRNPEHQGTGALGIEHRKSIADAMERYLAEHGGGSGCLDFTEGLKSVINHMRDRAGIDSPQLRRQLLEYLDYSDRLDHAMSGDGRRWREALPHLEIE